MSETQSRGEEAQGHTDALSRVGVTASGPWTGAVCIDTNAEMSWHSFIHSFSKPSLSMYWAPGIILVSRTTKAPALVGFTFQ